MLRIRSNNEIEISQGDAFAIDINMFHFKEKYEISENEVIYFTINTLNLKEHIFQLDYDGEIGPTSKITFVFDSQETKKFSVGQYLYDLRIKSKLTDRQFTLLPPTKFTVLDITVDRYNPNVIR